MICSCRNKNVHWSFEKKKGLLCSSTDRIMKTKSSIASNPEEIITVGDYTKLLFKLLVALSALLTHMQSRWLWKSAWHYQQQTSFHVSCLNGICDLTIEDSVKWRCLSAPPLMCAQPENTHRPPPALANLIPPHPSSGPWNNSSARSSQIPDPQTAEHPGANHLGNWSSQRLTFTRPVLVGLFGGDVTFSKHKHAADQAWVSCSLYLQPPQFSTIDSCFSLIEFVLYWQSH